MPVKTPKLPELPAVLPTPSANWVDYSILDEMASRLRNAGAWDNAVADGLAMLKDRIRVLEQHSRFERYEEGKVQRPLKSWEDCRKVLAAIAASRWSTFSDIAAPVESVLTVAVLLDRWEREGVPVPSDLRVLMHGAICVEWAGQRSPLLIDRGVCMGEVPSKGDPSQSSNGEKTKRGAVSKMPRT